MEINCKRFRFSIYQDHKVTGEQPKREVYFVRYRSADRGGKQHNFSLKMLLTTFHFKWRSNAKLTGRGTGPND